MAKIIDLDSWERKAHYLFYKEFENPVYNLCTEVNVSKALAYCNENSISFFHATLYWIANAANQVDALRIRHEEGKVVIHDIIHPGCTLLNENKTFSFCDFRYDDFEIFDMQAEALKSHSWLPGEKPNIDTDQLYCSVIPWINFSTFTHPVSGHDSGVPNIGIGKFVEKDGQWRMPISIAVNHMFVDGYHLGEFFRALQILLDTPDISLT